MRNPDDTAYNLPLLLRFGKEADVEALKKALKRISKAHPSANVCFRTDENGNPGQVYCKDVEFDIPVLEKKEDEIGDFIASCQKPFDLSKAPLYRFTIIRTEESTYLFSEYHHLVSDGTSENIFLEDLEKLLKGEDIPTERYTYFDHVADEIGSLGDASPDKAFFDEMMKDYESPAMLPPDLKGREEEGFEGKVAQVIDMAPVEKFCRSSHITEAGFFAAVASYTVGRYCSAKDIYLSTVSSGRNDIRNANTFGMFVNTLPIHATIGEGSVRDFIRKTAEDFSGAIDHEKWPFTRIVDDWGFSPEVVYAYQRGLDNLVPIPGIRSITETVGKVRPKFKIDLSIEDAEGPVQLTVRYNDALYSEAYMKEFARSFAIACLSMASEPDRPVAKVSLIDEEREIALSEIRNATKDPLEKTYTLFHEGVEEQAALKPDEIALIGCDGRYTFSEMDCRSQQDSERPYCIRCEEGKQDSPPPSEDHPLRAGIPWSREGRLRIHPLRPGVS